MHRLGLVWISFEEFGGHRPQPDFQNGTPHSQFCTNRNGSNTLWRINARGARHMKKPFHTCSGAHCDIQKHGRRTCRITWWRLESAPKQGHWSCTSSNASQSTKHTTSLWTTTTWHMWYATIKPNLDGSIFYKENVTQMAWHYQQQTTRIKYFSQPSYSPTNDEGTHYHVSQYL